MKRLLIAVVLVMVFGVGTAMAQHYEVAIDGSKPFTSEVTVNVGQEITSESSGWDVTAQGDLSDPQNGSFMLLAHDTDVTFGTVSVTAANSPTITSPPVTVTLIDALYTYDVDANGDPAPTYALTTNPTGMIIDADTGLIGWIPTTLQEGSHPVEVEASNGSGTDLQSFTINVLPGSVIQSDDFNAATLDPLWTFVNPAPGDSSYTLVGTGTQDAWVNIDVSGGASHQMEGGLNAPHLIQSINDSDFEVEVKFETPVTEQYEMQGIVVKQDATTFLRFEYFSTTTNTGLFAQSYGAGGSNHTNISIGSNGISPLYMRVARVGDQWTQSYSFDGTAWTNRPAFTYAITVSGVGPYVGNATGGSSPAHTGSIDYFFNTASPIDPEDSECQTDGDCGFCEKCEAGSCVFQTSSEDTKDQCPNDLCVTGFCDGTGACDLEPAGTECRAAAGLCDIAESCDGVSNNCPADQLLSAGFECRGAAGICDTAEVCDGVSGNCPADSKSTAECRSIAGDCDIAESCNGVTNDCPADGFLSGNICRAVAGDCDVAESCTGSAANCPADAKSTAVCRASQGICDIAESCNGVTNDCPADGFLSGNICRAVAGDCDVAESCTGSAANCPADAKSTAVCRASQGICDIAESCNGVTNDCPADGFLSGNICRTSAADCDLAESCNGSSATCPADTFEPVDTACGDPSDTDCTDPDTCDGAGACLNNHVLFGNPCEDGAFCTDGDTCDGIGNCQTGVGNPCAEGEICDDAIDQCVETQAPTYQFAEAGTKNFIGETTITVSDQINLDLYLTNVGTPQNAGGTWIDFTGSTAKISYVSGGRCLTTDTEGCSGPWVPGGLFLNEPLGAGTVLYQVGNLSGAVPDVDGDLIVGTLTLECTAAGDVTVDLTVIPGVPTWIPINDADVVPGSLLIQQEQPCTIDDECDDGLFCTGVETCVGGTCQDGLDPDCDDGIGCTYDSCDEVNDVCISNPNDGNCDDGDFCTGVETCDALSDCQAGTNPCPDDGLFCTGVESCLGPPFNRCVSGGDPCVPPDVCDENTDTCNLDTDEDGIPDDQDNCPNHPNGFDLGTCYSWAGMEMGTTCASDEDCNELIGSCSMNQEDTYPPQGNGIGDVCDCECDFDCDGDVDAEDVETFLVDFGRFQFNNPCANNDPCNGDCECDADVDADDVDKFLEDFGRFQFNNPCPACVVGDWCVYPIRYLIDNIPGDGGKNFPTPQSITLNMGSTACIDIYLSNVDAPQSAGGAWLDFTGSTADITYVSAGRAFQDGSEGVTGPWTDGAGALVNEPTGPGTVAYIVANLGGAEPDGDGDLIVGQVCLRHDSANDATINITTIPSIATWTPINDEDIISGSFGIHQ